MDEYVRFSGSQVMIGCFFGGGGGFTMFTVIGGIGPVEVFWDNAKCAVAGVDAGDEELPGGSTNLAKCLDVHS